MNLLFMDFETLGLFPDRHAPIDICLVETDRAGQELRRVSSKIKPSILQIEMADPKAIKVNGFNEEDWAEAPEIWDVSNKIDEAFCSEISKGKLLPIGWNIWFDLKYLKYYFSLMINAKLHHHPLDLMSMGWIDSHVHCDDETCTHTIFQGMLHQIERPSLKGLCQLLGVEVSGEHTAEGDVNMEIECYRRLI